MPGQYKLREKDLKLLQYESMGLTVTDSAKLTGMTRTNASLLLNRKLNKYKLSQDFKLLKKSSKVAHKIMDGFLTDELAPDGKTLKIKPSDALRIVEIQQARIDAPVKDQSESGPSQTFVQVNVEYLNMVSSPAVSPACFEVTPQEVTEIIEE